MAEGTKQSNGAEEPQAWEPSDPNTSRRSVGRFLSVFAYPALLPFALFSFCDATVVNARYYRGAFVFMGAAVGGICHAMARMHWGDVSANSQVVMHLMIFLMVDHPFLWMTAIAHHLVDIFLIDRSTNRLKCGRLHGGRIIVVGNGPSAIEGEPRGEAIDDFDEVVRFNNFQTKVAGMEKWVGTKCTVHFSDGVLYPTYKEYNVPGATVVLSLIMDRFMVAGTYVIMRFAADLQPKLTLRFLKDPNTGWVEKLDIDRLKKDLGLTGVKHPTSGMLAIDHFVREKGAQLPIYIHGFDFFMGRKMHYFDDHEPLYERVNDRIGVNMHSPNKEKIYVEKLIREGKVRFLKDM